MGGQGDAPGGAGDTSGTGGVGHGGDAGDYYAGSSGTAEGRFDQHRRARQAQERAQREAQARARAAAKARQEAAAKAQAEARAKQEAAAARQLEQRGKATAAKKGEEEEEQGFFRSLFGGAREGVTGNIGKGLLGGGLALAMGLNPLAAIGMILGRGALEGAKGVAEDKAESTLQGIGKGLLGNVQDLFSAEGRQAMANRGQLAAPGSMNPGDRSRSGMAARGTPAETPDAPIGRSMGGEVSRAVAVRAPAAPAAAPTTRTRTDPFPGEPMPPMAMARPATPAWLRQLRQMTIPEDEPRRRRTGPSLPYAGFV